MNLIFHEHHYTSRAIIAVGILFVFALQGCSGLRPGLQSKYRSNHQAQYVQPVTPVKNKKDDKLGIFIVAGFGAMLFQSIR
jgi:hypothetical protein